MSQTVAELLVDTLERIGVKHIFGLIGDSLNPLADVVRRSGIEWVGVRHEEGGWYEAEVHRVAGELALRSPRPDVGKAQSYFESALTVARQQQAKSWELRAATSLARLWRSQGKPEQARELIAPVYGCQFEQAKNDLRHAMRLSPRDPFIGLWQVQLGDVEVANGRIEAAIDEYQKAFDAGNRGYYVYANLAAAYALAGRMEKAQASLAEARRLNPVLTVKWYMERTEDIPILYDGLRKAGLPEE